MVHNQVLHTIKLFRIRKERGQSQQSFWDHFNPMRQVCDQLGLCIGQTDQGAKAVLKREGVTNPSCEQLKEVKK